MKKLLVAALLIVMSLSLLVLVSCNSSNPAPAEAASVTLAWDPPTTYFDGTPLLPANINFYTLYWGAAPGGPYPNKLQVGNVLTSAVPNLKTGTYYFVATCTSTTLAGAQESGYSNEVSKQIIGVPSAPANLR